VGSHTNFNSFEGLRDASILDGGFVAAQALGLGKARFVDRKVF